MRRAAGFQENPVQVAAVDDCVRVAEADAERLIERNVRDLLPAHGIHEAQVVDIDRNRARCVPDPKIVEARLRRAIRATLAPSCRGDCFGVAVRTK